MSRTRTETAILEERERKGVLVPILEQVLESQVDLEDDDDQWFMIELMKARAREREGGVFSPSMLGSCVRQAYFAKTGKQKFPATSPRTNFYFLDGNFRHYKWQFVTWKAHKMGLLELLGCEIRVFHPNGDFSGTIDAIVRIPQFGQELFPIDYKGMHVKAFQAFESYGTPDDYKLQIGGYGEIVNKSQTIESFMGTWLGFEPITRCLLVGENKGGPSQRGSSTIALHEDIVEIARVRSQMKRRMHTLRGFVTNEKIPPPGCTSTRNKGFQECPFAPHCRDEVKAIQAARESDKQGELSVRESTRGGRKGNRSPSLPGQSQE